jgi:hypothetical protein
MHPFSLPCGYLSRLTCTVASLLLAGLLQAASAQVGPGRVEAVWIDSIPKGSESAALRKDFAACLELFAKMDLDMELFILDKIHPHLEALYRAYAEMTGLLPRWDPGRGAPFLADIGKVRERTEVIHRLFDAGELEVSQNHLRDLLRHLKKLQKRFEELDAARAASAPGPSPAGAPSEGRSP